METNLTVIKPLSVRVRVCTLTTLLEDTLDYTITKLILKMIYEREESRIENISLSCSAHGTRCVVVS